MVVVPFCTPKSIRPLFVMYTIRSSAPAPFVYADRVPPPVDVVLNHASSEYTVGTACGCVETTCPPFNAIPVPFEPSTGLGVRYAMPDPENVPTSPFPDRSAAFADPAVSDNGQYSAGPSASICCPYADAGMETDGVVM